MTVIEVKENGAIRTKMLSCNSETAEKVSIHFTNRYKCHLLGICTDFLV